MSSGLETIQPVAEVASAGIALALIGLIWKIVVAFQNHLVHLTSAIGKLHEAIDALRDQMRNHHRGTEDI